MLSIQISIIIFILFTSVNSNQSIREYVIRKDFFRFFKAAEYTVYDRTEKQILYRLESKYDILQNVKLIIYPSKTEIGRLKAKVSVLVYRGEFTINDLQSNEKQNGTIVQEFSIPNNVHHIKWNERYFIMESKALTLTMEIREVTDNVLLAGFRIRPSSLFWTRKYDMKIYSDKYSEAFYLLAFAAFEQRFRKS